MKEFFNTEDLFEKLESIASKEYENYIELLSSAETMSRSEYLKQKDTLRNTQKYLKGILSYKSVAVKIKNSSLFRKSIDFSKAMNNIEGAISAYNTFLNNIKNLEKEYNTYVDRTKEALKNINATLKEEISFIDFNKALDWYKRLSENIDEISAIMNSISNISYYKDIEVLAAKGKKRTINMLRKNVNEIRNNYLDKDVHQDSQILESYLNIYENIIKRLE